KDIKEVALKIKNSKSSNELEDIINNSAYDKNICVEITNSENTIYFSKYLSRGCLRPNEESVNYKQDFIISNLSKVKYRIVNPRFDNKTIVYAVKLDNDLYAFVNTSIEPIDSTVTILKNQLIYVTLIVLILSFIVAYYISKHISKPIVKINTAAKSLAKGEYNVVFDSDTNIDELKELSSTLDYMRDELYKTDELRRDLMANVSHDLKTPLTMIKAYAEMTRDLHINNKKKQKENMNIIIEEADRLAVLVNDILTLSKMQSELDSLELTEFDLTKLIKDILKRYKIYKETLDYNFIYDEKEKLMIKADQKKIEQVIYNLINNAINYTGDDNKIIIKTIKKKGAIRVEITDTGKGIKKEDIPYIWDKYYKNEKKHERNVVGTGLGLSIVKSILELHKYEYGVISNKNIGTTFYFIIDNKQ
ncbi:MAG: HAMP domain-containing sensor histidine kinase, partial [bacterium]|nr:HAMP domain-containing sensor histidine kinase [bacterium]